MAEDKIKYTEGSLLTPSTENTALKCDYSVKNFLHSRASVGDINTHETKPML